MSHLFPSLDDQTVTITEEEADGVIMNNYGACDDENQFSKKSSREDIQAQVQSSLVYSVDSTPSLPLMMSDSEIQNQKY